MIRLILSKYYKICTWDKTHHHAVQWSLTIVLGSVDFIWLSICVGVVFSASMSLLRMFVVGAEMIFWISLVMFAFGFCISGLNYVSKVSYKNDKSN